MSRDKPIRSRGRAKQPRALLLHVVLADVDPPIWRRVWVDDQMRLVELHHILQAAMGWTDAHLHEFRIGQATYATPDPDDPFGDRGVIDERSVVLAEVLAAGQRFEYLYDFGDSWCHLIEVERTRLLPEGPAGHGFVEAGSRACPPEDCGGAGSYQDALARLQDDPTGEEARAFLAWAGADFDPERFDRRAANAALLRLAWNGWGKQ